MRRVVPQDALPSPAAQGTSADAQSCAGRARVQQDPILAAPEARILLDLVSALYLWYPRVCLVLLAFQKQVSIDRHT
jgi:hypothetical protein